MVTAAAVVPDARPTGLECFPALPGILSPLGFSMFAVSCISGLYCKCLKELSWYHHSGFSMMDLFFHCHRPGRTEHKEIRQRAPNRLSESSAQLLPHSPRRVRIISSPVKQGWSFSSSPILMFFPSISQSHLNPGVLDQSWNLLEPPNKNLNSVWDLSNWNCWLVWSSKVSVHASAKTWFCCQSPYERHTTNPQH